MSEEREPKSRPGTKIARIAVLGLCGGILAGGAGIYVMETSGNAGALASAESCTADEAVAAIFGERARGEVAAVQPVAAPFDASAIAFKNSEGETTTIGDFAGKTLLVNLWATWCAPCRAEMPALDTLEEERGGEDFAVVPVNVDMGDAEKPRAFYEETGLTHLPFYRDETMGVFNELKSQGLAFGLPVSLLVGPDGCARGVINGPAEWASPDALHLVDGLLETV